MATVGLNRPSLGIAATAIVLLLSATLTYQSVRSLRTNERRVAHTFDVLQTLEATLSNTRAAESALRGLLLTHDETFLQSYQPSVDVAKQSMERVLELTRDNPAQYARARRLKTTLTDRFAVLDENLDRARTNNLQSPAVTVARGRGTQLMAVAENLAVEMRGTEGQLLRKRSQDSQRSSEIVLGAFAATVVVTLTFLWIVARLVSRASTREQEVQQEIRQFNTELAALNETLEGRVDERTRLLLEANEELNAFAYTVAHDLRAPLRNMYGFAKALSEDYAPSLGDIGKDYTDRIMGAAKRLDGLIQDLLAYSRLTRTDIMLEPVNLARLVNSVLAEFETELRERGGKVEVPDQLPYVNAQPTILTQIVSNLVSNALKFVPADRKPEIRITSRRSGGIVRLAVRDNGIGIASQYHERIFKVFERLHGQAAYPGSGIGLAIVRKGMERMDGKVGVESVLGDGSEFWIELAEVKELGSS